MCQLVFDVDLIHRFLLRGPRVGFHVFSVLHKYTWGREVNRAHLLEDIRHL